MKIKDNSLLLKRIHGFKKPYFFLSTKQKKHINEFNRDVLEGKIEFEKVNCLCSNDEFSLLGDVDRYSLLQKTVMCTKCGLIQSNPRMTEKEYERFYSSDRYRNIYEPENSFERYKPLFTSLTGNFIVEAVSKVKDLEKVNSVMEIGAGGGWNLVAFKEKGINVRGCDYSQNMVSLGKKYNLNLFKGSIDDVEGFFDVIILSHVIEHFLDPIKSLIKIKQHLSPGGIIFVSIPDIEHFSIAQFQNAHTYYFSLATFQYYMSKSGLRLIYNQSVHKTCLASIFVKDEMVTINDLGENYDHMTSIIKKYRRYFIIDTVRKYYDHFQDFLRKFISKLIK